jgi:hypothetical protein
MAPFPRIETRRRDVLSAAHSLAGDRGAGGCVNGSCVLEGEGERLRLNQAEFAISDSFSKTDSAIGMKFVSGPDLASAKRARAKRFP